MSVEKFNAFIKNPESQTIVEAIPYAQINQNVIDNIDNAEAFLVWAYLSTKPSHWKVIKQNIKNKYGYGDKKIKNIFAYLHKHNLIKYVQKKNEKGKFEELNILVLNGSKFVKNQKDKSSTTASTFSAPPETGTNRNDGLVINNINNKTLKKRESKKQKSLPIDFKPDEKRKKLIKKTSERVGISEEELLCKFKVVAKDKGWKSCDWLAKLELFLVNERRNDQSFMKKPNEIRSTIPFYQSPKDDLPESLRNDKTFIEPISKLIAKGAIENIRKNCGLRSNLNGPTHGRVEEKGSCEAHGGAKKAISFI